MKTISFIFFDVGDVDHPALFLDHWREAGVAGRVATLLIEADRHVGGRIDPASGRIEYGEITHPEIDDLLDDLGELVLNKGGQTIIVPAERMPGKTGIAAIYRF